MNFLASDENIKVKLLKKEDLAALKSNKKSLFGNAPTGTPGASAEAARSLSPHLIANPAAGLGMMAGLGGGAAAAPAGLAGGILASATAAPLVKKGEPKVQLVEVETGIYDIYFTCPCGEQYIIRCESLDKAAEAPLPSAS
jgi:hypothetical protein